MSPATNFQQPCNKILSEKPPGTHYGTLVKQSEKSNIFMYSEFKKIDAFCLPMCNQEFITKYPHQFLL